MLKSGVMIYELIKLYYDCTGSLSIEYDKLEKAFYTLQELVCNNYDITSDLVFLEEIDNIEVEFGDIFMVDNGVLSYSIENINCLKQKDLDEDDIYNLDTLVQNINIYNDLDIPVPISDYKDLFDYNATIIKNYMILAEQEVNNGSYNMVSFIFLKEFINYFDKLYSGLGQEDLPRIKVIFSYYNNMFLLDDDSDFINADWYIVLFSKNKKQVNSLLYEKLFQLVNEDMEYVDDDSLLDYMPDDYIYDDDIDFEVRDNEELFDEISFFLKYFTILFNKTIQRFSETGIKDILIKKKYLLVAIQPSVEEYFLANGTIDDFTINMPEQHKFTDTSFMALYLTVWDTIDCFNYKDSEVNEERYADMIIGSVFIRSFLDLCVNEKAKDEIVNEIISYGFYKNQTCTIVTSLIDDIVFGEKGFNLQRNY